VKSEKLEKKKIGRDCGSQEGNERKLRKVRRKERRRQGQRKAELAECV
jgi:hypothetical protein